MSQPLENADRWLLPDGIEETLPDEARRIEFLRRRALDLLDSWGYELVMPPLMEYLDSLLTGVGGGLEIETFKLTDQMSGKMMGVRADMTPQVARIDAHFLRQPGASRLCYFGPVLRTRPDCPGCSRAPLQLGAELFGVASADADVEIVELLVETLRLLGVNDIHLDLGHIGIFQGLMKQAGLDDPARGDLVSAINCKSLPDVERLCDRHGVAGDIRDMLMLITASSGRAWDLPQLADDFADADPTVRQAYDNLVTITARLIQRLPNTRIYYDLSALRGQSYHTGLVFTVYLPGYGRAIANGGRYDDIGREFGRARPATGFSLDLRTLVKLASKDNEAPRLICAPYEDDEALMRAVRELREAGNRVVFCHEGEAMSETHAGTSRLVEKNGKWIIEA